MTTNGQKVIRTLLQDIGQEWSRLGHAGKKAVEFKQEDIESLRLVLNERMAQDERWGEQNHPLHDPALLASFDPADVKGKKVALLTRNHLPSTNTARDICGDFARRLKLTWVDIFTEEHCEFVEAGALSPDDVLEELVQTTAVGLAAIASELRRRRKEGAAGV